MAAVLLSHRLPRGGLDNSERVVHSACTRPGQSAHWAGLATLTGGPTAGASSATRGTRGFRFRPQVDSADLHAKERPMSTTPIADYALLSDRHSAALISRAGSIDWLCFPRFDSPSIFGRLLGDEAGHWSISAPGASRVTRRYLDRTMVLETTFHTPTGAVAITDALAMGEGNRGHQLGQNAPHVLLRLT